MIDVAGVELRADVVRAVALDGWRRTPRKTVEAAWDPSRPAELVARLREQLGPVRRIALSVGLSFLHVKHVKLPPAPAADRRRILALEPDRFFPVQGEPLVIALVNEADLAFAIDANLLERWIDAFEVWAPVESVEAAPFSLARMLGSTARGSFAVPAGPEEQGLIEILDGRVRSARRAPAAALDSFAAPLPARGGISGDLLCAVGAARGIDGGLPAMLLPDSLAIRVGRRRLWRASFAAVACLVASGLALWSVDRSRERTLARIRDELAVVAVRAQQAVELRDRLAAIDREVEAIAALGRERPNTLSVLAALSEQLPAGATVLSVRATGNDWQIDGTAPNAAAIIPLLDRDDRFEDVRFLSASTRFREGDRTYETFSIAFRVRPGA